MIKESVIRRTKDLAVRLRLRCGRPGATLVGADVVCFLAAALALRAAAWAAFLSAIDFEISAIRVNRTVSGSPEQYSSQI